MKKKIKVFEAANIPKMYRNIFEAYHNDSDLLSELLQNAVDSIRIANPDNPLIEVKFIQKDKLLIIKDNGLGMTIDDLEDFALGRTKKSGPQFSSLGGEKGIGSSYIFGGSDKFYIETCRNGKLTIAECLGAYDAIMADNEPDFFVVQEDSQERLPNYTEIHVTGNLFYLDFSNRDEIEKIVRTYSAVGYTLPLLGGNKTDIKVKLTWVDEENEETSKPITNIFRHPIIDANDKIIYIADADSIETGFGNFLKYEDKDNQAVGIFGESSLFNELDTPTGILLSVKGYPTAVEILPPRTGYAGYWGRSILILVNDDQVTLDPGRKSIQSEDRSRIREIAKDIFNKLVKYHKKFIRQTEAEAEKAVLDNLKEEARNLDDLNISVIPYKKVPDFEQGVIAIFHELLGAKRLNGYYSLSSSSDTRYDEIIYYEISLESLGENFRQKFLEGRRNIKNKDNKYKQVITVEYKLKATDIMRDVKKDLRLIDLLVAYDCDTSKLKAQWKWIPLDEKDMVFEGAKYQIRNPMNDACYVLLLKDFIENDIKQDT